MDSSSIASRIKTTPRIIAIRNNDQLLARIARMNSHQLWIAMCQKGVAGWKHKILSDELYRRKQDLIAPFLKEFSS